MALEYSRVSSLLVLLTMLDMYTARKQSVDVQVPIGAMFDHSAMGSRAALEYKLIQHNARVDEEDKGSLKLKSKHSDKYLNMHDVYSTNTEFCQLVKKGLFSMFGTHTVDTLDALDAYTSTFHMPFITPRVAVNNSRSSYTIFMQPLYARAVVDVIMHYEWKEVWYIHSNNEGLIRMQQIFDALAAADYVLKINVLRVLDTDDLLEKLMSLDKRRAQDEKQILLDLSLNDSEHVLRTVYEERNTANHHYFVLELGLSEMDLAFFKHGGMNITGFRMFDYNNHTILKYTKEWERTNRELFVQMGDRLTHEAAFTIDGISVLIRALTKLKSKNPTLFNQYLNRHTRVSRNSSKEMDCEVEPVIPWKLGHELIELVRQVDFHGYTGRVAFDKYGLRRAFTIGVLETTTSMALSDIGNWSPKKGLRISSPSIIRLKGSNTAYNRTRIVTSILTEPFLRLKDNWEELGLEGNDRFEGYIIDLTSKIMNIIKLPDYKIVPVKDNKYGARDENGTWNGMVGELIRGEADLAIAPLSITAERERYIDFSKPFMSLGISIMIKKPQKESIGVFSFMYPLSYEIWMCVIFAYIGVSVVLFLVSRFSPFEWHIEDNTDGPTVTNNFTIFNSLWFSLGAFMQQGCDIEPRSLSGRIVGSMWWFFTLIIISSYTANLAAFLTVQRMKSPIESADDLAKQTEIKYGTVDSGTTKEFFRTSTIPTYQRMWAFMSSAEPSVFVKGNKEGIERVRRENGRYAFLIESTANDYTNQRKPCDTMKVGANLDSKGYGIGTPLGSDLRDKITLAVLELRENGELSKLETEWWYDKGQCGTPKSSKKQETTNALKLQNVAGVFYILIGGLALGLLCAGAEFLYNSKMEAKRRQTTFMTAVKSKAHLSLKGEPERTTTAVGEPVKNSQDLPPNMSMSTYTYAPAAQLITFDGYADANTHTQV